MGPGDVYLAEAYQDNRHPQDATKPAAHTAAAGDGYPHPLAINLEPDGIQRFLELTVTAVG